MKTVGDFQTQDPGRLSEQLDNFQKNVIAETSDIRSGYMPNLGQQRFSPQTGIGATLLSGQVALCDSTTGNVSVVLSAMRPGWSAIIKRVAANTVNVFPSGTTGLVARRINATTSLAIAAVGVTWIYYDGSDWWA